MLAKPVVIETPTVAPVPFGLYSVANVQEAANREGLAGFTYEPVSCGQVHLTVGACVAPPDPGTVSLAVDDAGLATITAAGVPTGSYVVAWGDDTDDTFNAGTLDGATHSYAAPGDYVVTISGPQGAWSATGTVTVEDATASGPFDLVVATQKVPDDGVEWVESTEPRPHYALLRCSPVGGVDLRARAQAAIDLNEQRAVEAEFIADVAQTAVDITPAGGAVSVDKGAALLQEHAGSSYGGVAFLHVDRAVAHLMNHTSRQGNHLETTIGAWVAAGAGYADAIGPLADPEDDGSGIVAADGEAWMFVTGQVLVRRGAVELRDAPVAVGPAGADNTAIALAERTTTVSYECFAAAVRVLVTADVAAGV